MQPYEADEGLAAGDLQSPEPPAALLETALDAVHERFGLARSERGGKPFHDARVGVQRRKGLTVPGTPRSEHQSLSAQGDLFRHPYHVILAACAASA